MKKKQFGNTQLVLSSICYGTGNFGEKITKEEAFYNLDAFVDAGGNFIDSANVYCRWVPGLGNSSERYLGEWLRLRKANDKVVIATKGGHYDLAHPEISRVNRQEVRKDLEESLQSLGLDHLDFYWLHRDDPEQNIEEIIDMMEELVKEGKIRYYGASNYTKERLEKAAKYAKGKGLQGFSAISNQWSMASVNPGGNLNSDPTLVLVDEDYYQWHKESKMPLVPYSSAALGYLEKAYQGKPMSPALEKAYGNSRNAEIIKVLGELSEDIGVSVHALSLAWLMNQEFPVFPIASVTKFSQLEEFLQADEVPFPKELVERFH